SGIEGLEHRLVPNFVVQNPAFVSRGYCADEIPPIRDRSRLGGSPESTPASSFVHGDFGGARGSPCGGTGAGQHELHMMGFGSFDITVEELEIVRVAPGFEQSPGDVRIP